MLEDTIASIETRLRDANSLTRAQRDDLLALVAELKEEVGLLSKTRPEHAESIAGFMEQSTREAARQTPNPQLVDLSIRGLTASVEEFETSHPKLVDVVNSISSMLSNLGI